MLSNTAADFIHSITHFCRKNNSKKSMLPTPHWLKYRTFIIIDGTSRKAWDNPMNTQNNWHYQCTFANLGKTKETIEGIPLAILLG